MYHLCDTAFWSITHCLWASLLALAWHHIGGVLVSARTLISCKVFYALCPFSEPNTNKIISALPQPAAPTPAGTMAKKCKVFRLFLNILHTSVVYAVGTLTAQPIFPSKTQFFCNLFEFLATKSHSKIDIFCTLALNILKWTLLNLTCQGLPNNTNQEHLQISIRFSVLILFNFHWEIGSIINSFHTIASNSLQPSQCTPTHQKLFKVTKSIAWTTMV